ncbi:hypothetical protein BSKO_03047 [Bryopsis sp. KO-2023]|nr:hypothetical protein BSKO_03047 [Bryopsis sp. KO-2023]
MARVLTSRSVAFLKTGHYHLLRPKCTFATKWNPQCWSLPNSQTHHAHFPLLQAVPCANMLVHPGCCRVVLTPCTRVRHVPRGLATGRPLCMAVNVDSKTKKQPKQKQKKDEEAITPKSENFSRWYLDLMAKAELADYGPVRGTMVIRPYGYALWEGLQTYLDGRFKEYGVENAYFPQLIPYSFITREAEHVEGFSPELALVTKGGGKELEEPLVVRPTSETMINHFFAQWIQSYRDLPLLLNQWANVHRWEMRPRPFIRTLEFLWQEGHTAHGTAEEAEADAMKMIRVYEDTARDLAAMPVVPGRKSRLESFAGADITYTIEGMMGDKRALQAGTTHNLGTNFAKAFEIQYLDENQEKQYVHQTSWGMSTRMVGGVIMTHGDDKGLRLPPRLAPVQAIVIPILRKGADVDALKAAAAEIKSALIAAGFRVKIDDSDKSPGWKYNFWEMKAVPLRIEIGPRDLENNACVVARRDKPGKEGKTFGVSLNSPDLVEYVKGELESVHQSLLDEATTFRDENIVDVASYEELKAAIAEGKWARGPWIGSDDDELKIKEECQATLRCIPFDQPENVGNCFMTNQAATEVAIFAKAY